MGANERGPLEEDVLETKGDAIAAQLVGNNGMVRIAILRATDGVERLVVEQFPNKDGHGHNEKLVDQVLGVRNAKH